MSATASGDNSTGPSGKEATHRDPLFFLTILTNMKNKPEVDWDVVATKAGYSNANTARTRFQQIKRKLGVTEGESPVSATTKKKSNVGSGTNVSPSKVTKTPTKPRIKKEKANRDAEKYMEMEESKAHDMQLYADSDEYGYDMNRRS